MFVSLFYCSSLSDLYDLLVFSVPTDPAPVCKNEPNAVFNRKQTPKVQVCLSFHASRYFLLQIQTKLQPDIHSLMFQNFLRAEVKRLSIGLQVIVVGQSRISIICRQFQIFKACEQTSFMSMTSPSHTIAEVNSPTAVSAAMFVKYSRTWLFRLKVLSVG